MADKRRYADRRHYLMQAVRKRRKHIRKAAVEYTGGKCHREVHAGLLQLPREIAVEKSGEFKEA